MNFPSAIWVSLVERFLSCPPSWNLLERGGADSVQPNYRRENAQKLLAQCKHLFGLGLEDNAVSYKQIQPAHLTQKLWKALKYLDVIAVKSRFCWKTKTFSVQTHTLQKSGFQLRADRGSVFLELRMLPVLKFTKHFERKNKSRPCLAIDQSEWNTSLREELQRQARIVAKMAQLDLPILAARTMISVGLVAAITVVFCIEHIVKT